MIQTQLSIDAKTLIDFLRTIDVGRQVTYSEMSKLIGRDVSTKARHCLARARIVLLREGIRFDVERGRGCIRRMSDSEIARSGARSVRLVGRMARREAGRVRAVKDFDALSNEDKIEHNATLSVLGAVAHFSKPTQVKILEAAVAAAHKRLPPSGSVETIYRALGGKAIP